MEEPSLFSAENIKFLVAWLTYLLIGVGVVWGLVSGFIERRRANKLEKDLAEVRLQSKSGSLGASGEQPPGTPSGTFELEIPKELSEILSGGKAVLYVGSDIGELVGTAGQRELLQRLINRIVPKPEQSLIKSLFTAIQGGNADIAADFIRTGMADAELRAAVEDIYAQTTEETAIHQLVQGRESRYAALAKFRAAGVLSATWDPLLPTAYANRNPFVLTPDDRKIEQFLREERFFVMCLWGRTQTDDMLLFTESERDKALWRRPVVTKFLGTLVGSRPLVFFGASLEEIENLLDQVETTNTPQGFAFVMRPPERGDWILHAERMQSKFGVEVIEYPPEVERQLLQKLAPLLGAVTEIEANTRGSGDAGRCLTEVRLHNIGPFSDLKIELRPGWNVLLGNNASGKSTILKAIALGLCGDDIDAQGFATRLLRVKTDEGLIELKVDSDTYATKLQRELDKVRLSTGAFTAVQRGSWVVLAFPPLRGISLRDPMGATSPSGEKPQVADLLPILRGGPDSRLDDLKQWIVNMHSGKKEALINSLFKILRHLTPGEQISFDGVESGTFRVLVKTSDGEVPIEQVSQGMSSMIGWVGTLLQRMYEIYPHSEAPEKEPALVLVDEIDAHLHPAWQRMVVPLVQEHFPAVQVVATTHSPLVVSGLDASCVLVARRDPGDPTKIEIARGSDEVNISGMRADQILTSTLFGLSTTRGENERALTNEYARLLGKQRTPEDETRFQQLRAEIEQWHEVSDATTELQPNEARQTEADDDSFLDVPLSPEAEARVKAGMARISKGPEDVK